MTEQEKKQQDKFVDTLFEHMENIQLLRPALARDFLHDIIDAAIKDVWAGNLTKDSHIINYIKWINEEILGG